jgi:hypothetical protein
VAIRRARAGALGRASRGARARFRSDAKSRRRRAAGAEALRTGTCARNTFPGQDLAPHGSAPATSFLVSSVSNPTKAIPACQITLAPGAAGPRTRAPRPKSRRPSNLGSCSDPHGNKLPGQSVPGAACPPSLLEDLTPQCAPRGDPAGGEPTGGDTAVGARGRTAHRGTRQGRARFGWAPGRLHRTQPEPRSLPLAVPSWVFRAPLQNRAPKDPQAPPSSRGSARILVQTTGQAQGWARRASHPKMW